MVIFFILIGGVLLAVIYLYNRLISLKNKAEYAFSSVDVMLKKRADLIPQLTDVVRGYMNHEKDVLSAVTKLRNRVSEESLPPEDRFAAENRISSLLKQINIAVENYPDLKAGENFLKLQNAVGEAEEHIAAARRAYNAAVYDFNNALEMFPSSLIARSFSYERKVSFEVAENIREMKPLTIK